MALSCRELALLPTEDRSASEAEVSLLAAWMWVGGWKAVGRKDSVEVPHADPLCRSIWHPPLVSTPSLSPSRFARSVLSSALPFSLHLPFLNPTSPSSLPRPTPMRASSCPRRFMLGRPRKLCTSSSGEYQSGWGCVAGAELAFRAARAIPTQYHGCVFVSIVRSSWLGFVAKCAE